MLETILNNDGYSLYLIIAVCAFQIALAVYMAASLQHASKERSMLHKEVYGLVKRIEVLTSNRREQVLKHYDKILANLSQYLPATIASEAGQNIFETESKIISRLAELEPNFRSDESSQRKMDELIRTMEGLEQTVVELTSDAVKKVMLETRSDLFADADYRTNIETIYS